jgi:hypothetical protein
MVVPAGVSALAPVIVTNLIVLVRAIRAQLAHVAVNKARCERLSARLQVLQEPLEARKARKEVSSSQLASLRTLEAALNKADEMMQKWVKPPGIGPIEWARRLLSASKEAEALSAIQARIDEAQRDLQFQILVQTSVSAQQDRADREADFFSLQVGDKLMCECVSQVQSVLNF